MTRDEQWGQAAGGVAWVILGVLGSIKVYAPLFAAIAAVGVVNLVLASVGLVRGSHRRHQPRRIERI